MRPFHELSKNGANVAYADTRAIVGDEKPRWVKVTWAA
jgi:hypothetical protein